MNRTATCSNTITRKLLAIIMLSIFCLCASGKTLAIKTNVNEVTDLFDKHIEDKEALFDNLKAQNNNAITEIQSRAGVNSIEGVKEAENKSAELNAIKETDLDNAGRAKRASEEYRFYNENELEPDYTKPGNRLHKKDSDDIASATDKKTRQIGDNFMAKLKAEGFDCKTVKGSVIKEPVYYIEIKKENQKNTEYDQVFCEELRNKYNCRDKLALTCGKKGKAYGEWQTRFIRFNGHWIYANAMHWGYAVKWKEGRWGWHISPYHPTSSSFFGPEMQVDSPWRHHPELIIADARRVIAAQIGVGIDQVGENIIFPGGGGGRGIGDNTIELGQSQRWRVIWAEYEFQYHYRDARDICEQWSENWTERCYIQ